ncbi:MAG: hypothetical protein RQ952_06790 [Thermoproteota archaeon]|jgi:hypothetical protein|nr:hypothetical protein [Thermoproteota archaeon]
MRKLIRSRRGDISAPVITILLVIASISIAALVISWLFGVGLTTSKQGLVTIVGTPTIIQSGTSSVLYITLKNNGNDLVSVTGVVIFISSTTYASSSVSYSTGTTTVTGFPTLQPGQTVTLVVSFNAAITGSIAQINGVIQTTSGTIPFTANVAR